MRISAINLGTRIYYKALRFFMRKPCLFRHVLLAAVVNTVNMKATGVYVPDFAGEPQALDCLGDQLAVQRFRTISEDRIWRPSQGIIVEMLRCYAFTQYTFDRFILKLKCGILSLSITKSAAGTPGTIIWLWWGCKITKCLYSNNSYHYPTLSYLITSIL